MECKQTRKQSHKNGKCVQANKKNRKKWEKINERDNCLVTLAQQGNNNAFNALVCLYMPLVYKTDTYQDVGGVNDDMFDLLLIDMVDAIKTYDVGGKYSFTQHMCHSLKTSRKKAVRAIKALADVEALFDEGTADPAAIPVGHEEADDTNPESILYDGLIAKTLANLVEQLPPHDKEFVCKYYYDDIPVSIIAHPENYKRYDSFASLVRDIDNEA
jgi:hypothetical protein